uniref:hypothetical protein n=1 Tax=Alistipes sp. D31t1_170403_E11 TaxID=2787128 RepID=UPI001898BE61|nr:hypothetical protein [Alistipes sp. D31t1_170403_E11]
MIDEILSATYPKIDDTTKPILLIGIGFAGCNMLRRIRDKYGEGNAQFCYISSDASNISALRAIKGEKILIGVGKHKIATPDDIKHIVEAEHINRITASLQKIHRESQAQVAIIYAGFGGKTGTGVTPVVGRILNNMQMTAFCVVTVPFSFEGTQRMQVADAGIKALHQIDGLNTFVLHNNMLIDKNKGGISINDAFSLSDDFCVLPYEFIEGLFIQERDLVNVDFQDVRRCLRNSATSFFTYGRGAGENRISEALDEIVNSPYLYGIDYDDISSILIQISSCSAENLLYSEVVDALQKIQSHFSKDNGRVDLLWGTLEDKELNDDIVIKAVIGCKSNHEISYFTAPSEYLVERSVPFDLELHVSRLKNDYPGKKIAFIIMRFGTGKAYDSIVASIRKVLEPYDIVALRADDKEYHDDLFPNILTYIYACDFGIAIYENIIDNKHNPNVALEVGIMFGLGKKVCLLKQRGTEMYSDITGKLYKEFDIQDIEETITSSLNKWVKDKKLYE